MSNLQKKQKKILVIHQLLHLARTTKDRIKEKLEEIIKWIMILLVLFYKGNKSENNLKGNKSKINDFNDRNFKHNKVSNKNKKSKILNNFHNAISSTKSDQIIVKMLELNENDIITFYTNLEKLIGKDMSVTIREQMSKDIKSNSKDYNKIALCPFCRENKSNCVILLCGHMICHICAKNINRCKYPCPKCKIPINIFNIL